MPDELLFREEAFQIIGACLAVHKDKGNGFAEPVYQDALEIELELSSIPYDPQRTSPSPTAAAPSATPTPRTCFATTKSSLS